MDHRDYDRGRRIPRSRRRGTGADSRRIARDRGSDARRGSTGDLPSLLPRSVAGRDQRSSFDAVGHGEIAAEPCPGAAARHGAAGPPGVAPGVGRMSETAMPGWEERLRQIASGAVYPATPDLWPAVRRALGPRADRRSAPRLGWAAALGAVALAVGLSLFAIPTARAALYRVIQLGVVRIFAEQATATPPSTVMPVGTPSPTAAPELRAPLDLLGATSLESVRQVLGDAFRMPTYPPDLGDPDLAYLDRKSTR